MKIFNNRPHPSPQSIPCLAAPRAAFLSLICCGALLGSAQAATRSASGTTLNIDLNVANQVVTVVSTGTTYTFTLSGGATNTWAGSGTGTVVATTKLTVTPGTTYNAINLTDSATGTAVTFNTSGVNAYVDDFNVTLDNTPGAVTFNGASKFTGAFGLSITTARNIDFASASSLSLVNGNLTLDANTQVTPTTMLFSGIMVNNATVTTTGSGITTLRARGGTGASASNLNKGIAVIGGGSITGGTTGTMTLEGKGFTEVIGPKEGQGICVTGRAATNVISTITSNGADVSVTGYGANNTDTTVGLSACNTGVVVGIAGISSGNGYGKITSGGNGRVTVTGYGGTVVSPAISSYISCVGVQVVGSDALISSGGTGKLTVDGTGGDSGPTGKDCLGVSVFSTDNGGIVGGPGGSVEVTGRGAANGGDYCHGVFLRQSASIKASAGAGTTLVTGYGGGSASAIKGVGVHLYTGGVVVPCEVTSAGSGSVTVRGYGGNSLGTGKEQFGVNIDSAGALISSGGGAVRVEGYGGGGPASTSPTNYGVGVISGGSVTAGGLGGVTVIGRGGKPESIAGDNNYGVYVTNSGINVPCYISSGGGDVVVEGYGGGGSSDSPSASSSKSNFGVYLFNYSTSTAGVTAGGSGRVTVTGKGGNLSADSTGISNHGIYMYGGSITSSGGEVTVHGTGGGDGGSGSSNYGINVYSASSITSADPAAAVSLTGTGGNSSGALNRGVMVSTSSSTVSSGGGPVTIIGTGGGRSASASNYGVDVSANGLVTSGGSGGTVTVIGRGGNLGGTGGNNHGVYVSSTLTTGGGNLFITATEGGLSTSTAFKLSTSSGTVTTATHGGFIFLVGDSYDLTGPISAGVDGTVTLAPRSSGVALNLGLSTDTAGGPIALSTNELNRITAGTINLGNAQAGAVTVSQAITVPAGSNLNLITAAGASLTPSAGGTDLTLGAGKALGWETISTVNLALNSSTSVQSLVVAGDLSLTGKSLNLSGTYTPVGGAVFTIVNATNLSGTFEGLADGTVVPFNGSSLVIGYTATSVRLTALTVTNAPVMASVPPTSASITATGATLGGEVTSSDATVTERGIVYSITAANAAPQVGGSGVTQLSTSGTTGTFTVSATGLTSKTTYSFRAYAISSAGTSYGTVGSFTTPGAAPLLVSTPASSAITAATATLGGEVSSSEETVTGRGIVYSLTATNAAPQVGGTGVTQLGTSGTTGAFTVSTTGLTSKTPYSFRAYAISSAGTSYSAVGSFTTLASPPTFAGYAVTTQEAAVLSLALKKILARATDPDGGAVSLTRVFGPSAQGGVVSLTGSPLTGTLYYTPPVDFVGADSFDIELTGSQGGTLRATLSVSVTLAPNASNQSELKLHDGVADMMFRGIPKRSYQIQRSTDLRNWTTIGTVTATLTGKIRFTDTAPPQPSGYYRSKH
jgi:hypothetical protein